jgi:hydrogenase maturation protease
MKPRPVVIGLGDRYRHDDGVGIAVIDHLCGRGLDATLVGSDGETSALLDLWSGRDTVFLIDAVHAEPAHPGRVHRLVVTRPAPERARAAGLRGADLGSAVDLARATGRQPDRMIVFAVEAENSGQGRGLTAAVAAAARRVADEIAAEIGG